MTSGIKANLGFRQAARVELVKELAEAGAHRVAGHTFAQIGERGLVAVVPHYGQIDIARGLADRRAIDRRVFGATLEGRRIICFQCGGGCGRRTDEANFLQPVLKQPIK
ncbi:MAG: hypothetical protein WAU52_16610 [Burkholderiales bacterium]